MCASMRPGSTVMPRASIVLATARPSNTPDGAISTMRSLSMSRSAGCAFVPVPSKSDPPRMSVLPNGRPLPSGMCAHSRTTTIANGVADAFRSATEMVRSLRSRKISAAELLAVHAVRIARHNPALNAIVTLDLERAEATARAIDAAPVETRGTLCGLPLTIKDNLNVAGLRTTAGIQAFASAPVADRDATVVARLRPAGGVVMGKTNLPPAASDYQTTNAIFGRTVNPYDATRTPGGSTGGGAAAVAAGLSPLEIGTDIGGSIRVPAAYCGIYGHKPSETLVPRDGQVRDFPVPNPAKVGNVQGPLARDAADLELALDVIAGPVAGEDIAWRLDLGRSRHDRLAEFRVAMLPPIEWLPLDDEIRDAFDWVASTLSRLGARVGVAKPESFGDLREYFRRHIVTIGATLSTAYAPALIADLARRGADDEFAPGLFGGMQAGVRDYLIWLDEREAHRGSYRSFFTTWDVLVAPISPVLAFTHDDRPFPERDLVVNGTRIPYNRLGVYPSLATHAGQPATVFPVRLSGSGLPISLQAIGPYLEDRTPIRFAQLLGREIGGYEPPASYQ
ncbi:MAG: amidase [Chloroflexi bacterium]|nr:MAG: amidase [Chloroflexota bacterium]